MSAVSCTPIFIARLLWSICSRKMPYVNRDTLYIKMKSQRTFIIIFSKEVRLLITVKKEKGIEGNEGH